MSTKQRKMVELDIDETSGVDHPAHLREGWVVMKSATSEQIDGIFGATTKGKTVAEPVTPPVDDAVAKELEALKATNVALAAENETLKAAAVVSKSAEDEQAEILKALPAEVRKMLEDQDAKIKASDEALAKERDARLDEQAVAKSRNTYKSIAINHEKVAPALRRVAEIDAELAAEIETALSAADGQLDEAGLLGEVGGAGLEQQGDASAQIDAAADKLVEAGTAKSKSDGIAKALSENPELYLAYMNEKAGK